MKYFVDGDFPFLGLNNGVIFLACLIPRVSLIGCYGSVILRKGSLASISIVNLIMPYVS